MKTKLMVNIRLRLTVSILLGLLTLAFIPGASTNSIIEQQKTSYTLPFQSRFNDAFYTGIFSVGNHTNYTNSTGLNLNLWHEYPNGI